MDYIEFGKAYSFISRGKSPQYVEQSNVCVINQACIRWNGIDYSKVKYQNPDKYNNAAIIQENDILIASTGTGTLGRCCVFRAPDNRVYLADSHVTIVRRGKSINSDIIRYYMMRAETQNALYAQCVNGSTNQIELSKEKLQKFNIPNLNEEIQKRIIDTLVGIETVIDLRTHELQKLDELIKARFVEIFGEPIQNPMGWPVVQLKKVSTLITNGNTPKGGSENYVDEGITFLRSQNVWRNRIDLEDVAYIDEATHRSLKKSSLHYKDILITKTGRINTENSSLGRAALFLGEDNSANINGHVYLIRLDGSIVPEFVVTILTGEAYRKYIRKVCVGGIDKRQINVDQVEDFPIIVPPYEMQKDFAEFREQVDKSKVAELTCSFPHPSRLHRATFSKWAARGNVNVRRAREVSPPSLREVPRRGG